MIDNTSVIVEPEIRPTSTFARTTYVVLAFSILVFLVFGRSFQTGKKLPPGVRRLPRLPGLPYAGRFWDVPGSGVEAAWHFGALHKKYGPIYEWKVMGTTHIWIETDEIARELFVNRQKNYCDRSELPAGMGIKEDCEILPLSIYNEDFKRHKNFVHAIMRESSTKFFYGWPTAENKKTLRRLLETPDRWSEHLVTHCARIIGGVAWGDPEHGKKMLVVIPELLKVVSPEGPIINKLTFLKHLPAIISPFKKAEARRKSLMQEAFYEALEDVRERVQKGIAESCWGKLWINSEKAVEGTKLDHHEAAYAIGSNSFVAIATIGGPLHAFFLAICHYPSWMLKLQEEVDRVCGDRLPTFQDMPQLPRIRATVKEVLRWRQSTPLGVPRECIEDDVYDGYLIPKGAMLHANFFVISRVEERFPRPTEFVPERWLDPAFPTYKEPLTEYPNVRGDIAFGYGNRACPGVDLTNTELCTLFGALAWAFNITPKEETKQALPWYENSPWVITMAKHFPINIQPRSDAKRRAIIANCSDPGYLLTAEKRSKWDVTHEGDGRFWKWEGLTPEYTQPETPKVYPPGV